jgi:hypothetical protein
VNFIIWARKKFLGVKPIEKFSFPGEKGVEGGDGQRFAETPWAREKIYFAAVDKVYEISRFIHVKIPFGANCLEGLNADGQLWQFVRRPLPLSIFNRMLFSVLDPSTRQRYAKRG